MMPVGAAPPVAAPPQMAPAPPIQPPNVVPAELITVEMPEEGLGSLAYWQGEIEASKDQLSKLIKDWQTNLDRYNNKPWKTADIRDRVWVPKDFALAERKRPALWFQVPELFAEPKPGHADKAAAATVFAALLNHYLNDPNQGNADVVMTEVTFDAIVPAGIMVSKIGYEAFQDGTRPEPTGQQQPDPTGAMDPMTGMPAMVPVFEDVPNIIKEEYRWERFSPTRLRLPTYWVGSDYDKSPWIGMDFERDRLVALREYDLTEDELPEGDAPDESLNRLEDKTSDRKERRVVRGTEIFYYAHLFDAAVKHPDLMRQLVIIGDQVVVHRDSPYQELGPDGKLTGDSLLGNPIHVGTVRTVSDGKFPNSDCQQTRPQVDELSTGRTQMVQQRNRNIPQRLADKSRLDAATQKKLTDGVYQEIILTDGPPDGLLIEAVRAQFPRENFAFNDQIDKDLEECWALGANQLGLNTDEGQTATEASLKQRNTDARLAVEQARVKNYFLSGAQKYATLLQRFLDPADMEAVVGKGADTIATWDRSLIQGSFLWSIKPDAQLRKDMSAEREFRKGWFNFLARDPRVNHDKLLLWVFEPIGLDGTYLAPAPKPQEPPPKVSLSIKGEDLIPYAAQYANIVTLLTNDGVTGLSAQTAAPAGPDPMAGGEAQHDGLAATVSPLSKHSAALTGGLPGPSQEPNTGAV